ncbi:2-oxoglutarate dehydrogenase E1 component [uncultured Desulfuromonas sp.]|uniref:2-oxoglutarate dehydrogenase E1 component n=1 Tax=uncultured Desulfuromonas sp. TaxID=181013 RepID=UPI0026389462|nr:2-oxoglutarate dehydrogenase E1 component [uncultured Desulfuromonas sp.]
MSLEANLSPAWIESLYRAWQEDPDGVPPEWGAFFRGFDLGREGPPPPGEGAEAAAPTLKQSAVQSLIYRYRDIGHLLACTDPLSPCALDHPLLDLETFDLETADLDRVFAARGFLKGRATLREILDTLRQTYCRSVGVEFMHIQDPAERRWLIDRMEPTRNRPELSGEEKQLILEHLQEATLFEEFLHRKFLGQKRFSLEGGEALIPVLDALVRRAASLGVRDLVLGMPHRGRLNVLANIFHKPLETIFAEFADNLEFGFVGEGDVKYHKGFSVDHRYGEHPIHLSLASNPSHLEAVDPVVEGKCRARQEGYGADGEKLVLPVLIHGDAAFAGQGVVTETLNLSGLEGYRTGGTVHIVVNNQIGFTTAAADARSTRYATDVAKMLMVPIFHVHGEDPEAAVSAVHLALDYRQAFGRDAVVEIICYRRHGHNEGDEPYFTQPLMYGKIKDRPPAHEVYAARLVAEGKSPETVAAGAEAIRRRLEEGLDRPSEPVDLGFRDKWGEIERDYSPKAVFTGVETDRLQALARQLAELPAGFTPHPKAARLMEKRREAVLAGAGIDWAAAEALAFGSLLAEGVPVRLSGQDSRRGTFSQRHSTIVDMETGRTHVPLAALPGGAAFRPFDSSLSEAAVLGFEYGYSLETPGGLTLWEAQFGDFVNGAQVIIDQFIASGAAKWDRASGLALLLPHGYEGQGPEHSSARIERFLQLCAGDNLVVAVPSTPAQYFHLLRRQVLQSFRRPLIVLTPKSLLRHPECVSELDAFAGGPFREVLPEETDTGETTRVLLCSGKVYYDLDDRRRKSGRRGVAIVRLEQLFPLRSDLLKETLEPFAGAEVVWVQEEPENGGAWPFLRPRLTALLGKEPRYVGRDAAASPAVGSHRLHTREQEQILAEAFGD